MEASLLKELTSLLAADRYVVDPTRLAKFSHDASSHTPVTPESVISPRTTEEVSQILTFAHKHQIPVTAWGAGSGLEGNAIPLQKGIVLSLSDMNHILDVYPDDFQVVVQPGIIGDELNRQLATHKLYFPAFPASSALATVGGMIANNAGGMYAIKYGVVGDWVMQLTVVLADGTVIATGSRSIKSVAGYDLKYLFIGSEGTLGIVTQATLRLVPVVSDKVLFRASFATISAASRATLQLIHAHLEPAAIEFLDTHSVRYINAFKQVAWDECPTLLIEFQVGSVAVDVVTQRVEQILKVGQARQVVRITGPDEIHQTWRVRSAVHTAVRTLNPELAIIHGDIGLPLSHVPKFLEKAEELVIKQGLFMTAFGHIGDGNVHIWLMYDSHDPSKKKKAFHANSEMIGLALSHGGTCTAEHGVGIGKKEYLKKEHPSSLGLMKSLKKLLDPVGILNPGKIF